MPLQQPTEEPKHVGKAIQIGQDVGIVQGSRFGEPDGKPLSASTDRAGHVKGGSVWKFSRNRPILENSFDSFDSLYLIVEYLQHRRCNFGDGLPGFRWRGDCRANFEEVPLYCLRRLTDLQVIAY